MDGHLTTTQSRSKKKTLHCIDCIKEAKGQMDTDIRFSKRSQQAEQRVGLQKTLC